MKNLALVLDEQGKYDEAEKLQRQTLQLKEKAGQGASKHA
jgi:Flp pilus assembly protein TadD